MIRLGNRKGKIILILVASFLLSCDNPSKENIVLNYYPSGTLKEKIELKDSVANGWYIEYYENGKIKSKSWMDSGHYHGERITYYASGDMKGAWQLKNDSYEGPFKTYHPNGNLQYKGFQKYGAPYGWHYEYKLNDNGKLSYKRLYTNVKGEEEMIREIEIVNDGTHKDLLPYVKIHDLPDTAQIGNEIEVSIELIDSSNDFIHFILGGFESKFNMNDSLKFDTVRVYNNILKYRFAPNTSGKNYLRGIVLDEKVMKKENGLIWTDGEKRYFEFKYYAK